MLNTGSGGATVFKPPFVRDAPGDTVTFKPTDPGHNAGSIPSVTPAGATPFKGAIGRSETVRFAKPGLYGYKFSAFRTERSAWSDWCRSAPSRTRRVRQRRRTVAGTGPCPHGRLGRERTLTGPAQVGRLRPPAEWRPA